jgi:predicted aldo/keto reductase-like oxidoreductase
MKPMAASDDDFLHRTIPALGRRVHRLGLACNYGIDERGFEQALERGVQYLFWTTLRTGHLLPALKQALKRDREQLVVAAGATLGWFGGSVRRAAEKQLRELETDYLDVFHLFWLGKTSAWTDGTIEALAKLKDEGKIRAAGISIHDRARAGRMVGVAPIDLYMLRYNAAHPGAERDVFPNLPGRSHTNRPAIVAYTATDWRKLLKAPRGWDGPVMSAGDCYRFCLSSPHVDLALSGPKDFSQLEENLAALERGPLTREEDEWMRRFGAFVHGGAVKREATSSSPAE